MNKITAHEPLSAATDAPVAYSTAPRRRRTRALTLAAAALAGLIVWAVSTPLFGITLTVGAGPRRP